MDWQFKIGLGLSFVFGLLPYAVKDLPGWVSWSGLGIGVVCVIWGLIPGRSQMPLGPSLLFVLGCALVFAAIGWYREDSPSSPKKPSETASGLSRPELHLSVLGGNVYRTRWRADMERNWP